MDVIERNVSLDHFMVRCDCFTEFIEFSTFDRGNGEVYINYYGTNHKKGRTEFVFKNPHYFESFIIALSGSGILQNTEDKQTIEVKIDIQSSSYDILLYNKIGKLNSKKCIWEIVLSPDNMTQLTNRCKIMLDRIKDNLKKETHNV